MRSAGCALLLLGFLCLSGTVQSQSFDVNFLHQAAVAFQGELPCKDQYDCDCMFNHQRGCCCAYGQFCQLRGATFDRLLSLWRTLDTLSGDMEAVIGDTHVSFTASFNLSTSSFGRFSSNVNLSTSCFGPFSSNVTIPFNVISLNHGNGYNPGIGIFTAPRSGLYFFSFTAYSNVAVAGERLYYKVQLVRNGEVIASAWEDNHEDSEDSATQTVILSLDRGGQVYVQLMYGRRLCDTHGLSIFSGYLIYPHDP